MVRRRHSFRACWQRPALAGKSPVNVSPQADQPTRIQQLRLLGPAGSNTIMAAELSRLARRAGLAGFPKPRKDGPGAIVFEFSPELARLCMMYHRTCSRVLWDVYSCGAQRLEPLYDQLLPLIQDDPRGYLQRDFSLSVSVRGAEHFAAGERQIVGTVKNAIVDGAATRGVRARVADGPADVYLLVQVKTDRTVLVSLDLGGRPMNQRGYRVDGSDAPLRENLAAMLVMLARHDPRREILVDPMAGTGTIAIEAACLAQARPVWTADRSPSGYFLPELGPKPAVHPALFADAQPCIVANELDAERAQRIGVHAERAQVAPAVQVRQGDFRDLSPQYIRQCSQQVSGPADVSTEHGLFLCNPPYGERLDQDDLLYLYRDLGRHVRTFPGFRCAVLVANPEFEAAFGGRPRIKKPLSNGPLRGYFLLYDN